MMDVANHCTHTWHSSWYVRQARLLKNKLKWFLEKHFRNILGKFLFLAVPTEKEGGVCPSRCRKYEIVPACSSYSACWVIVAFSVFQWDFKKWCLFWSSAHSVCGACSHSSSRKKWVLSVVWSPGSFHPAEVAGVLVADGQFHIQFYRCNFSETTELGQLPGFACSGTSRAGQFSLLLFFAVSASLLPPSGDGHLQRGRWSHFPHWDFLSHAPPCRIVWQAMKTKWGCWSSQLCCESALAGIHKPCKAAGSLWIWLLVLLLYSTRKRNWLHTYLFLIN